MNKLVMGVAGFAAMILGASPALAAGERFAWQLNINEARVSDATLFYAVPNTDYQLISLSCEEGGARVFASLELSDARLRVLGLKSGAQALIVGGKSSFDDVMDSYYFSSQEMDARNPLFDAFAASGSLTQMVHGNETVMSGDAKAKALISRFVKFCRGSK